MAGRIYFINFSTRVAIAYDHDGNRQSADDIRLGTGSWTGGTATSDRLFFLNNTTNTAVAYDHDGNRQAGDDISLGVVSSYFGALATSDRIYFLLPLGATAIAYDFNGNRQSSDDISLQVTGWTGGAATSDRLFFLNNTTNTAVAYDHSGRRQSSDDITLGTGSWTGGTATSDRLFFLNNTTNTAVAYDHSGRRQSSDDITLGTGSWTGGTATPVSEATLTITTTDTDIREGETVNFNIASSIAITDFTAGDITVTNGTRGRLTGSGQNWTLSVVAGSAGTLRIAIAEDVVSPGNAAVSQDFTVSVTPITTSMTPRATAILPGESTVIDIVFSAAVTNFVIGDISASVGSLSGFTGSGTTYSVRWTAPASGRGTATISIAANVANPRNNAASADITYAVPAVAKSRLFFIDDTANKAVAYDFGRTRHVADDITLGDGTWQGAVASDTRIYIISGSTARAYDVEGNREAGDDITFASGSPTGGVASDDRLYFFNDATDTAIAYDFDGNRQVSDDISLGNGAWRGGVASDDRLYFVNNGTNTAVAYDFNRNRQSADDISLPSAGWQGGVASDDRLYFVNFTAGMGVAYDFDGTRQATDDIDLGTGSWRGGTSTFANQATLTISTDDTDIRAGETVDFNIAADIAITDFVAGDITVTGGTRGALTGSGRSWTLSVTAGAAGTLRIAIAEDVVTPGNAAVSQDFTVNALPLSFGGATVTDKTYVAGDTGSFTLPVATGGVGAKTYSVVSLPTGFSFDPATRVVTVAPESAVSRTTVTYTVRDSATPTPATQSLTFAITVLAALSFGAATITDKVYAVGDTGTFTLPAAAGGVGAKTYSIADLPTGFSFNANTRVITAAPGSVVARTTVTYRVTDSRTPTAATQTLTFDITVNSAELSFGDATIADKVYLVGDRDSFTLPVATGGTGTKTYSTSSLPTGFSFDAGTRVLTVAPTAVVAETTVTYTVTDSATPTPVTETLTFDLTVFAALSFGTATVTDKIYTVGDTGSFTLPVAIGGIGAKTYSVADLPTGFSFDANTRTVTIAPQAAVAQTTVTYRVRDADVPANTDTLTFDITVFAVLAFSASVADRVYIVGASGSFTLPAAIGGRGVKTYSVLGLPTGFTFDADTRVVTIDAQVVVPATEVVYTVTDSAAPTPATDTLRFDITVTDIARVPVVDTPDALTLYAQALNRVTTPAEAGDNDYSTATAEPVVSCEISDAQDNAQTFDTIFVKCSGVERYSLFLDGTDRGVRVLPTAIAIPDAEPAIPDVSITRDGYQHDLVEIQPQTARSVVLQFMGTDVRINEVLILRKILEIDDEFVDLSHSKVDIDSVLQESDEGEETREIIVGRDRLRWMSTCVAEFTSEDGYEELLNLIEDNPNPVVALDPKLYPWRVHKAVFPDMEHNAPYLCHILEAGNTVEFRLLENRKIGADATLPLKTRFNDVDAQDKYLFFRECVHLNNNRVFRADGSVDPDACDNDFATYSTATTLEFDISEGADPTTITHVWLKATGVTAYQVQTLVSNVWTTQETITPTQQASRGWEHSLVKLDTAITATRVRLVFAGTGGRVSEVMLLSHAGGLVSMTNLLPIKVSRTSIIQQTQAGETSRAQTEGATRFKWKLNFTAVFGHGNTHVLEDFLDFINSNPAFIFAERPEKRPHRVYPAGFLNSGFNATFLTATMQIGEMVSVQLSER